MGRGRSSRRSPARPGSASPRWRSTPRTCSPRTFPTGSCTSTCRRRHKAWSRWLGWLPLALRIAGGRLAARPTWSLREFAARLADTERRLDELEVAEGGVRVSFAVSYEQLRTSQDPVDRDAARVFTLLGMLDGP